MGRVRRRTEPVNPECAVEHCHPYALARRQASLNFRALARNLTLGQLIEPEGSKRGAASMPERNDEPGRVRSVSKMSNEDAERLRELLRRTEPADMSDPSLHERVGKEIAKSMHRPFKRDQP